ncbi:MAG: hypothetical protein J7K72_05065 [Candidatus Aenigmarchaeota archaeon]|nr:hypothetical protein [Candidatus Aenigmarchaeota archaeon]
MALENLIFNLEKKYSLPILILLYFKNGLTFDQIYDLSISYKSESMGTGKMKAFMEKKEKYGAISRESISRAVSELLKARYIKKEARLMRGKAYITYTLTNKTRKLMDKYFRKD